MKMKNYIKVFGKLININVIPLLDTTDSPSYEDYVEWCEDNGNEPQGEFSQDYFRFCNSERDCWLENFWWCVKNDKKLNRDGDKLMVTGRLGLWYGRPTIVPEVFDNMEAAMNKIIGNDIWDIRVNLMPDGCIEVQALHHDGTNTYYIHRLNKKGKRSVEAAENRWEDPVAKQWMFKRFYIDEIEF